MKCFYKWAKCLVFFAILVLLLARANQILIRKSLVPPWDMSNKIGGFYNERGGDDVYFLGTSHSYCSFVPSIQKEMCGVKSYVFASQKQPMDVSYYYLKEAVKKHKPQAVVLDVMSCIYKGDYDDEGVVHSYADPLPLSLNKLAMVVKTVPRNLWPQAVFPLIKYHSRWSELKEEDFSITPRDYKDPLKGHVALRGQSKSFAAGKVHLQADDFFVHMREGDKEDLRRIKNYCEKKGIRLFLVKTPTYDSRPYQSVLGEVEEFCRGESIPFRDYNETKEAAGLARSDYYDGYHLNERGAEKFNRYIASEADGFLREIRGK